MGVLICMFVRSCAAARRGKTDLVEVGKGDVISVGKSYNLGGLFVLIRHTNTQIHKSFGLLLHTHSFAGLISAGILKQACCGTLGRFTDKNAHHLL